MTDKIDAVNIMESGDPIQTIKDSKHFCILPWIHLHAWPDDRVMPCCIADSAKPVAEYQSGMDIMDMDIMDMMDIVAEI